MRLSVLTAGQARSALTEALANDLESREGIADLIRHEVSARAACARHFVVSRVRRLAAPVAALSQDQVEDICEDLEREGDVLVAEGAVLHASPVRIILGARAFRFVCAVPTARLVRTVAGPWSIRGVRRVCTLEQPIEGIADAMNAIVVTPEVWAGLDRAPHADDEWLRGLDARLAWTPEPAKSLERDEPLEWGGYETGAARWTKKAPANLWRARHRFRQWVFAWTAGQAPCEAPFASLRQDEATRTTYALSARAGHPLTARIAQSGGSLRLELPSWLPLAEYRYLTTTGERLEEGNHKNAWAIAHERRDAVLTTLSSRLGLRFAEGPT